MQIFQVWGLALNVGAIVGQRALGGVSPRSSTGHFLPTEEFTACWMNSVFKYLFYLRVKDDGIPACRFSWVKRSPSWQCWGVPKQKVTTAFQNPSQHRLMGLLKNTQIIAFYFAEYHPTSALHFSPIKKKFGAARYETELLISTKNTGFSLL